MSRILEKLVALLVDEYGYGPVFDALQARPETSKSARRNREILGERLRRKKAVNIVSAQKIDDRHKKAVMLMLARRFDRRQFLPRAGDVNAFLESHAYKPVAVKSRSDSFRRVLKVLLSASSSDLDVLAASQAYSGPARLDALSDAIRTTGHALRERSESLRPVSHRTADDDMPLDTEDK